jgi:hypothetical protein
MTALEVTARPFREKQKNYLDKVDEGLEILIRRGKYKSYKVVAASDDDTLMSKEAFLSKIDSAMKQHKERT